MMMAMMMAVMAMVMIMATRKDESVRCCVAPWRRDGRGGNAEVKGWRGLARTGVGWGGVAEASFEVVIQGYE
jgi:hypothetical protein